MTEAERLRLLVQPRPENFMSLTRSPSNERWRSISSPQSGFFVVTVLWAISIVPLFRGRRAARDRPAQPLPTQSLTPLHAS